MSGECEKEVDLLVLGGGPGGYTAAFRAADLGLNVTLVERYSVLGGVCLNVGCIPSKALLHAADVINEAAEIGMMGVHFPPAEIDLDALRSNKERIVSKLNSGLSRLAQQRKVTIIQGEGQFISAHQLEVTCADNSQTISFKNAIIASGSRPVKIPGFPHDDPRLMDSTDALALEDVPKRLLLIGGGIIGLEMASLYSALGSKIDIVEMQANLIPGCDKDLVRPLAKRIKNRYQRIMLSTSVTKIEPLSNALQVTFDGKNAPESPLQYDKILVAVGRTPNGHGTAADKAGVEIDPHGFIKVDQKQRSNIPHIYAIGDVAGGPMLAHKASREAKIAAEVIAGHDVIFDPITIPSVAYTDPEIAWVGLTETEAKEKNIHFEKAAFPWAASGRALGIGREEGITKLLYDAESKKILGAGITGVNAGELIGEALLALQMGATISDISQVIHPHPTLNETLFFAAEMAEGTITDIMPPRRRKH